MKENNEITLKILEDIDNFKKLLLEKKYKVIENFILYDLYMIPEELDIKSMSIREIISKAIIIRKVEDIFKNEIRIDVVYKMKEFNEKGDIINQKSSNMKIKDYKEGIEFFKSIGFKELMNIVEEDYVYSNGEIAIATKDIKNGDKLIEVETNKNNPKCDTIDKIKEYLRHESLPLDFSNCFIKKAEVELDKKLNV